MNPMSAILIVLAVISIVGAALFSFFYKRKTDIETGRQLADMMSRHYDEVKNVYLTMRGWRHDYHNHIQTMKGHMALDQQEEMKKYLNDLDTDLKHVDNLIKSGNLTLDAILNSKVSLAAQKGITITLDAYAGEKLSVTDIDLCVIIGNLMDNAIDACTLINEESKRFIRVYIDRLKDQFYISVTNSTSDKIRNDTGIYETKKDKVSHGNGLKRIDSAVEKYDGFINRQNEPGVFSTEIMLPL